MIDYKRLLQLYLKFIRDEEGTDEEGVSYLFSCSIRPGYIAPEEWMELQRLAKEPIEPDSSIGGNNRETA